tara:strand:+ start:610 stop:834 length:225 start_codon:yes stop_codon:yes gene_type:complete
MNIEKNIPIPSRRGRKGKYAFVYKMVYGDSIVTRDEKEKQKISAHIRYSDTTCRVVVRTMEDGSIRVWKIKKDD